MEFKLLRMIEYIAVSNEKGKKSQLKPVKLLEKYLVSNRLWVHALEACYEFLLLLF